MEFEWDERKNLRNIEKHGIDFSTVFQLFGGSYYIYESLRSGNDEKRYVAIGIIEERIVAAVYTPRGENIRIISIRRARYDEEEIYETIYGGADEETS